MQLRSLIVPGLLLPALLVLAMSARTSSPPRAPEVVQCSIESLHAPSVQASLYTPFMTGLSRGVQGCIHPRNIEATLADVRSFMENTYPDAYTESVNEYYVLVWKDGSLVIVCFYESQFEVNSEESSEAGLVRISANMM